MAFGLYVGLLHCRGRRSSLQFPLASVSQFSAPEWAVLRSGCTSDPTVWYSMHSSACSCMKSRESLQADAANCGIQILTENLQQFEPLSTEVDARATMVTERWSSALSTYIGVVLAFLGCGHRCLHALFWKLLLKFVFFAPYFGSGGRL